MRKDDSGPVSFVDTPSRAPHVGDPPGRPPAATGTAPPTGVGETSKTSARTTAMMAVIERTLRSVRPRPLTGPDQLHGPGPSSPEQAQKEKAAILIPREHGESAESETPPSEHLAWLLKDVFAALSLSSSMGAFSKVFDVRALKLYRDNLLADAGNPSDPIEIMLVEQLALAHLNIGRLHGEAATARDLEHAKAYGSLAIGLTGEFPRTALALKAYRTPDGARPASRGEEQSAVPADREVSAAPPGKKGLHTEVGNGPRSAST